MKTPVDKPGMENWVDVIPHRDDVLLQSVEIFSDYLVLNERINGILHLTITWKPAKKH